MKVLHAINSLGPGGAERLVVGMAKLQREAGLDVRVLALSTAEHRVQADDRVPVEVLAPSSAYSFGSLAGLSRHVKRWQPDIVHAHLFPAQLYAAMCAGGARLVTTEHNTFNRRRRHRMLRPIDRAMYARYDAIASISEATKAALESWCEIRVPHVVIPNGISPGDFAGKRRTFPGQGWRLLTVARLEEQKGLDTLLEALARWPRGTLQVVGTGSQKAELERRARAAGVEARVEFVGYQADVAARMAQAHVYVQPSRWEGFGIAAVEAMACGLPVVCSDVPGLSDVVGPAGIAFPSGDAAALAAALERITQSRELYETLSANALSQAALYSLARTSEAYCELYRRVGSGAGAAAGTSKPR